jgi:aspartate/methionine/tyrosine aminotransferase
MDMTLNDRLDALGDYPFRRLANLLAPIAPPDNARPLALSAGDPTLPPPEFVREVIARHAADWVSYPPHTGCPEWRDAVVEWLYRRFTLAPGMIEAGRNLIPAPGTREALFQAGLACVPPTKGGARPLVAMPNPYYPVYAGAGSIGGGELLHLPATRATGFLPDLDAFEAMGPAVLDRLALFYLCSPANPQGVIASRDYMRRLITLGRRHGFVVAIDECYNEIWWDERPGGGLEAANDLDGTADGVIVFHSLSKRSSAAGLRSGFVAGCARVIGGIVRVMEYGGAGMPLPVQHAAAALWRDEEHVAPVRAFYRRNFEIAERAIGSRLGFYRPPAGFFLWLEVGDDVEVCTRLWREAGLRTLPGSYIGRPDAAGVNPGAGFLRVAMCQPHDVTEAALERLIQVI